MKTERRHELQTNTLAQSLGEGIEKTRPYINQILLAIGGVIVVLLAVALFRGQARAKKASAWEAYFLATTDSVTSAETEQEQLRTVIKNFGDTDMADWARLTIGDEGLSRAAELITQDKSEAQKNLNAAIEEYRPLAESSDVPAVRDLANYNMGLCYELQGQLDKAEESFRKVKGTMAKLATERADKLKEDEQVREFYDWFAKAEPPRRPVPGGGNMPGRMPAFDPGEPKVVPFDDAPGGGKVPGGGDLPPVELFPEKKAGSNPAGDPGDVDLPSLDTPADPKPPAEPAPPAGETPEAATPEAATPETPPADSTPADEPAATPEKPAEPADSTPAEKPAAEDAESPAPAAE